MLVSLDHRVRHWSAALLEDLFLIQCHVTNTHSSISHLEISSTNQRDFIPYGRAHANHISLLCRQFAESAQGFPSKAKKLMKNLFHLNIAPHVHQRWHQSRTWRDSWIFHLSIKPLKSPHLLDLLPGLVLPLTHEQYLQSHQKSWPIIIGRQLQRNPSWASSSKLRPATHSSLQPSPSQD